jgi:aminoglycoside 6'-N-acetyltransferase
VETLVGRLVILRRTIPPDATAFREVLSHPEVARWWGDPDEELGAVLDPPSDVTTFAIVVDGATVGLIQSSEELTPHYRHAGIDLAVHPDRHGRGIGTDAIVTLGRHLIDERGHHRLTIDPAVSNEVAISVYRRVGFRSVGVLREYELAPDGGWRDGLLMDLLAHELVAPGPD